MSRVSIATIKTLIAKSRGRCAFSGCNVALVEGDTFLGEIAHIVSHQTNGPRFRDDLPYERRNQIENLILLCAHHHLLVDKCPDKYSVAVLKRYKSQHEVSKEEYQVPEKIAEQALSSMNLFIKEVFAKQKAIHPIYELAIELPKLKQPQKTFNKIYAALAAIENNIFEFYRKSNNNLIQDAKEFLNKIGVDRKLFDSVPCHENPFINRCWEIDNLGSRNWMLRLHMEILYAEINYLSLYNRMEPNNTKVAKRLKSSQKEFDDLACNSGYAD